MTVPFALLADFIERLTDPRFGTATNEVYAVRLATVLDADPESAVEFANRALRPADLAELSLGAWLWYLAWRRQRSDQPPEVAFLDALYDSSAEPIVRFRVVQESASHPPVRGQPERGLPARCGRGTHSLAESANRSDHPRGPVRRRGGCGSGPGTGPLPSAAGRPGEPGRSGVAAARTVAGVDRA